jgi:hypothetical protein
MASAILMQGWDRVLHHVFIKRSQACICGLHSVFHVSLGHPNNSRFALPGALRCRLANTKLGANQLNCWRLPITTAGVLLTAAWA